MYFFDGKQSRKGIDLGGSSSQSRAERSRAELLKKAQRERDQRERDRLLHRSATLIQAFFRAKTAVRGAREVVRKDWDLRVGKEVDHAVYGGSGSDSEAAAWLATTVAMFTFLYRPRCDEGRLAMLVRICLHRRNNGVPLVALPYIDIQNVWPFRLKKLISIFIDTIATWDSMAMIQDLELRDMLQVMEVLHDEKIWHALELPISKRDVLAESIINAGLFKSFRLFLSNNHNVTSSSSHTLAIATLCASIISLHSTLPNVSVLLEELTRLLSEPLVVSRMGSLASHTLSQHIPLYKWLMFIASCDLEQLLMLDDSDSTVRVMGLLSNMAELNLAESCSSDASNMLGYLYTVEKLVSFLPEQLSILFDSSSAATDALTSAGEGVGDDDDEIDGDNGRADGFSSFSKSLGPPVHQSVVLLASDPVFLASWSKLWSAQHIRAVARASVGGSAINQLASLLCALFRLWPSKKSDVIRVLRFQIDDGSGASSGGGWFESKVLEQLKSSELWSKAESRYMNDWLGLLNDQSKETDWIVLTLICELLSRVYMSIGDDEFFGPRNPVAIPDLVALSSIIRNACFALFWHDQSKKRVGGSSSFTQIVAKLLEQLYLRDSRRSFCPASHWLMINDFDMDNFIQYAIADMDDEEDPTLAALAASPIGASRAMVEPRQAILDHMPFVIPFNSRVKIMREWIRRDRERFGLDDQNWIEPMKRVTIRRNLIIEDGFEQLNELGSQLKRRVAITFVSDQGLVEAGIDGGGVFKEFLTALTKEASDPQTGLFEETSEHLLFPFYKIDPIEDFKKRLERLEFVGRIIGKALFEGILIDVGFAGFFLAKWLNRQSYLDDLPSLDAELYKGLLTLKNYPGDVEKDFSLTFSTTEDWSGKKQVIDLVSGGSNIPVTNENRLQYIILMSDHKLNRRIRRQSQAFFSGLRDLINPRWLRIFNQQELQVLLGGAMTPIDLYDLKRNVVYGGDYHELHPTIRIFWEVVQEMTEEERRQLVKFVTSCARPPLMGFAELKPNFCIRQSGEEDDRLPTASTCVNLLKLPPYRQKDKLRSKILYAITYGAGFELS